MLTGRKDHCKFVPGDPLQNGERLEIAVKWRSIA